MKICELKINDMHIRQIVVMALRLAGYDAYERIVHRSAITGSYDGYAVIGEGKEETPDE